MAVLNLTVVFIPQPYYLTLYHSSHSYLFDVSFAVISLYEAVVGIQVAQNQKIENG